MPSALRKLVKARDDLKKRSRHLAEDDQEVANQVVQTADTLIQQFTSSVRFDRPANDLRGNITTEESTELTSSESIDTDDITISEEEELQIISISDRFGFTERERRIFHLIIDAVALASGGRDTDTFARYLQQIETSLEREFQTSQKE